MTFIFQHRSYVALRRRAFSVGGVVALVAVAIVAPAYAADECDGLITGAADYEAELLCASEADGPTTVTFTTDVVLDHGRLYEYDGQSDLTIDGGGYSVTSATPTDESKTQFLLVPNSNSDHVPTITVQDITVSDFSPDEAALRVEGAHLKVDNSTFTNNMPRLRGDGGAIFATQSVTVTNSTFDGNGKADTPLSLGTQGGAIYAIGPATVSGSTFANNVGRYGAAIYSVGALRVENSTFSNNVAHLTIVEAEADAHISSSTFVGNESLTDSVVHVTGGATSSIIENSTFASNAADLGAVGTGYLSELELAILHSTFAGNTGNSATDIYDWDEQRGRGSIAQLTIIGTVFTGDPGTDSCAVDTNTTTVAYSFDADGSCTDNWAGEGNIGEGLNAHLGTLANNGGTTPTLLPLPNSPLIDAIPTHAGSPVSTDQRGINRPQGNGYDIGAVEIKTTLDDTEDDTDTEGDTGTGGHDAGLVRFHVTTDAGTLHGTASPAITVTNITWTPTTHLTGAPADTALPYGAAGFTIQVPQPGASTTITLTAPTPFTNAYKTSNGTWTTIPGATWSPDSTTITYTLTDGGPLDEDGHPNGYIIDPIALALTPTFTG